MLKEYLGIQLLELSNNNAAYHIRIKPPSNLLNNTTYFLPLVDGESGQVLSTDGAGNLSWVTGSGGGGDPLTTKLTGFTSWPGIVTSEDTILQAFEKIDGNLANVAVIADAALPTSGGVLTGNLSLGANKITSSYIPDAADVLINKGYLDTLVITGGSVKECVLIREQFVDGLSGGICAAEVFYCANNIAPANNDTITLTNGTTTETYTFKTSPSGAFDVAISGSEENAENNLATAINVNSTQWYAKYVSSGLDFLDHSLVVIYERTAASGQSPSRIYGTFATQENAKVVEFYNVTQYTSGKTAITMPSSDPGAGRFGFRKVKLELQDGEIHLALATNQQESYNQAASAWFILNGSGSVPNATSASGGSGSVYGILTVDSDTGLVVNSGILRAVRDNVGGGGLAKAINLSANGIAVKIDASSIEGDPITGALRIKALGVSNSMLAGSISYSKLSLSNSIVNADINATAAIAISKLGTLTGFTSGAGVITSADTILSAIEKLDGNMTSLGASPLTTKGDLYTFDTTNTRLPVGNDGWVLTADSTQPTGLKWSAVGTSMSNPMTTLGDIIYEDETPAPARLAGNTTTTKKFLTQTGTGSISTAPGWNTIDVNDLPIVTIAKGGTGQSTKTNGFNALSPITSTGDLIIGSGSSSVRLAIGANGTVLGSNGTTASWIAGGINAVLTGYVSGVGTQTVSASDSILQAIQKLNGNINALSISPSDIAISALDIDWSLGDTYYKTITTASAFTFSNTQNGQSILVAITNSTGGDLVISFPAYTSLVTLNMTVASTTTNIYTFIKSNGVIYAAGPVATANASRLSTTATSNTTTTLTATSSYVQYFTGTANQTVVLPTTAVAIGLPFLIINRSTGVVTVQSSNGNTIQVMTSNTQASVSAIISTPTLDTDWDCTYSPQNFPGNLKNDLLNGNFSFWQRGTSTTVANAATGYQADRWYVKNGLGTNGVITYSQVAGVSNGAKYGASIKITTAPTASQANVCEFYQLLDNDQSLKYYNANASFTANIKALGNVNQVGVQFCYSTTEAKPTLFIGSEVLVSVNTSTFSIASIINQAMGTAQGLSGIVGIRIRIASVGTGNAYDLNNGFIVEQASMNVGTTPMYSFALSCSTTAMEFSSCQRFYQEVVAAGGGEVDATNAINREMVTPVPFMVFMRATPAVTLTTTIQSDVNIGSVAAQTITQAGLAIKVTRTTTGVYNCERRVKADAEI